MNFDQTDIRDDNHDNVKIRICRNITYKLIEQNKKVRKLVHKVKKN